MTKHRGPSTKAVNASMDITKLSRVAYRESAFAYSFPAAQQLGFSQDAKSSIVHYVQTFKRAALNRAAHISQRECFRWCFCRSLTEAQQHLHGKLQAADISHAVTIVGILSCLWQQLSAYYAACGSNWSVNSVCRDMNVRKASMFTSARVRRAVRTDLQPQNV